MSGEGVGAAPGRARAGRWLARVGLAVALLAALPAPAAATQLEPGTPAAVAPGVPGHGRAWELVTPPDPVAAALLKVDAFSPSGDRVVFETSMALPEAPVGIPLNAFNFADRAAGGWVTRPLPAPRPETAGIFGTAPKAADPGLTTTLWSNPVAKAGSPDATETGLFEQAVGGGSSLLAAIGSNGRFVAASPDLRHVLFATDAHLLPADAGRSSGLSLYELEGSTLRLVDVDSGGALISPCGVVDPDGAIVSSDGSRIFFRARPGCSGSARVFMRAGGTTTEISASQCHLPDCGPEAEPDLAATTPSGAHAFIASTERLTDDEVGSFQHLYRYDVGTGELSLVAGSFAGDQLDVQAPTVLPAGDGSRVFFVARRVSGTGCGGCLFAADAAGLRQLGSEGSLVEASAGSGRFLLFTISKQLVEADRDARRDVYRYDAETGAVSLLSVGSIGGDGPFDAEVSSEAFTGMVGHGFRAMSDDGSRAFFTTAERLLPEDRNEVADVYEWADGDLALVSSGVGTTAAQFAGITPDAGSAFVMTSQTLLPRDRDGGDFDLYAARTGGGFPEAGPPPRCAESCREPGPPTATERLPAAAGLVGSIRLRRLGAAARRRIVARGWIDLLAEVPAAGRLSGRAKARLGRRPRLVAAGAVEAPRAGPVRLRLRLSGPARRRLARGRGLRVSLVLRLSGLAGQRRATLRLRGQRRAALRPGGRR